MIKWYTNFTDSTLPSTWYSYKIPIPPDYPNVPHLDMGDIYYENHPAPSPYQVMASEIPYLRISRIKRWWYLDDAKAVLGRFRTLRAAKAAAELLV